MLQEQFESAVSLPELWTKSVGWFKSCTIRQSAFMGISGNMEVCSELFFITVRINQACGVRKVASTELFHIF